MAQSITYRHKSYELLCTAKPLDSGKFAPNLVVIKQVWPTRPRQIAVDRGNFSTAQDAIDAAQACGIEWVTNYG